MNAANAANGTSPIECAGCRRAYSRGAWLALPVVRRLTGGELSEIVIAWEKTRVIEVRACTGCGRKMARVAQAA